MFEYPFKTEPFKHQLKEFEEYARLPSRALLWEMGTGKSKAFIDSACLLFLLGEVDGVILLGPSGIPQNWENDELPTHVPDTVRERSRVLHFRSDKSGTIIHQTELTRLIEHRGLAWLLMTYDTFVTDAGKQAAWKFMKRRRVKFGCDEASDLKSPTSARSKSVVAAGQYAPYRSIMEGTPVTTGPFDLYAPIRFLDPGFWVSIGLGSFAEFKANYGVFSRHTIPGRTMRDWNNKDRTKRGQQVPLQFDKLLHYRRLDELQEILAAIGSRVLKKDVLDLPPKLYEKRYFQMSDQQASLYQKLKDDYMAEHAGGLVTAALAITRLLRFQQVTCGYLPAGDESDELVAIEGPNPRLALFKEVAGKIGSQGIVWARFTQDIDLVLGALRELGMSYVRYDGQVSDDEREVNKQAFNRGDKQWFVGNQQAGGRGLTLLPGVFNYYYSNSFSLKQRLQSEDRPHRSGQKNAVLYMDGIAEDTVDLHILRSLRNNFDVANQVTGDEVRAWI